VSPDTVAEEVEAMVQDLDLNRDGAVDLWEFCVQMQIMKERKTKEEREYEVSRRAILAILVHSPSCATAYTRLGGGAVL
jgi:predicted transporter